MIPTEFLVGKLGGIGAAVRSFVWTFVKAVAIVTGMGIVLAAISYYVLRAEPWTAGIAAAVAIAESIALGALLGFKKATANALLQGVRTMRLGRWGVRFLFDRVFRLSAEDPMGQRGNAVAQTLERLPLAQAEKRLSDGVRSLVRAPAEKGGLTGPVLRWLQRKLLRQVEKITLAQFRTADVQEGGVDLAKCQTDLEEHVDNAVADRLEIGVQVWTIIVLAGLPVIITVQTLLVVMFLHAK